MSLHLLSRQGKQRTTVHFLKTLPRKHLGDVKHQYYDRHSFELHTIRSLSGSSLSTQRHSVHLIFIYSGFDVHQKNYHARPDSLKILYCTKSHKSRVRQLQTCVLTELTVVNRKYKKKYLCKLLPFPLGSEVERNVMAGTRENSTHMLFLNQHIICDPKTSSNFV